MYIKPKKQYGKNFLPYTFFINFTNSYQQPKCITANKIKKLQKFQSRPVSITITKSSAVSALVLNV